MTKTLSYVTIRYENPIIYLTFKQGTELGFPEMRELVFHAEELSNKKNYVVFSDIREGVTVTPAGRKYASETKNSPYQKGTAVLVGNNFLMLATNFFMGFTKTCLSLQCFYRKTKGY